MVSCWRGSIVMLGQATDLQHPGDGGTDRSVRDGGLPLEQLARGFPGEVHDRISAFVLEKALNAGVVFHLLFEAVFGFFGCGQTTREFNVDGVHLFLDRIDLGFEFFGDGASCFFLFGSLLEVGFELTLQLKQLIFQFHLL
jgi:hypothetical protein